MEDCRLSTTNQYKSGRLRHTRECRPRLCAFSLLIAPFSDWVLAVEAGAAAAAAQLLKGTSHLIRSSNRGCTYKELALKRFKSGEGEKKEEEETIARSEIQITSRTDEPIRRSTLRAQLTLSVAFQMPHLQWGL